MRGFLSIFFAFLILMQSGFKLMIIGYYHVYQDEITQRFCENKSRPTMNCKGKCYLKKQLKAQEKTEHSRSEWLKKVSSFVLGWMPATSFSFQPSFTGIIASDFFHYQSKAGFDLVLALLRPPRASF